MYSKRRVLQSLMESDRSSVSSLASWSSAADSAPRSSSSSSSSHRRRGTSPCPRCASCGRGEEDDDEGAFECNICLAAPREAVVSLCGHLFCWACLHRWLAERPVCPVCGSAVSRDKVVPLYGRGGGGGRREDPLLRDTTMTPPRPRPLRTGPPTPPRPYPELQEDRDRRSRRPLPAGAFPSRAFGDLGDPWDCPGHPGRPEVGVDPTALDWSTPNPGVESSFGFRFGNAGSSRRSSSRGAAPPPPPFTPPRLSFLGTSLPLRPAAYFDQRDEATSYTRLPPLSVTRPLGTHEMELE